MSVLLRKVEGGYVCADAYPDAGEPADWQALLEVAMTGDLDTMPKDARILFERVLKVFVKAGWRPPTRSKRGRK